MRSDGHPVDYRCRHEWVVGDGTFTPRVQQIEIVMGGSTVPGQPSAQASTLGRRAL